MNRFVWEGDDIDLGEVDKFNPRHDERGRFATGEGGSGIGSAKTVYRVVSETTPDQAAFRPKSYNDGVYVFTSAKVADEFAAALGGKVMAAQIDEHKINYVDDFTIEQLGNGVVKPEPGVVYANLGDSGLTDKGEQLFVSDPNLIDPGTIVRKFNPYHGEHGRFTTAEGASAGLNAAVASALQERGGFTFNTTTVKSPHHGYAVGGYGTRDAYDANKFALSDLQDYLSRNRDALQENFLGGWLDKGKVYLDVTKVFPENERDAAIRAGRERNQIAIADLAALNAGKMDQALIDTGGTGKAEAGKRTMFVLDPRQMTAEEMHAALMRMIEQLK